nr:hypothetical protein [uncultured Flavobacterium sp.]
MKQTLLSAILVFSMAACNKTEKEHAGSTANLEVNKTASSIVNLHQNKPENDEASSVHWSAELLAYYIKNSDNELINQALKNNRKIEWLFDRTESIDSTKYLIFNIGLDVYDEGETNKRFSSCGWIYIDSLERKIYEYDLPNDTLIEWKKQYSRKK